MLNLPPRLWAGFSMDAMYLGIQNNYHFHTVNNSLFLSLYTILYTIVPIRN